MPPYTLRTTLASGRRPCSARKRAERRTSSETSAHQLPSGSHAVHLDGVTLQRRSAGALGGSDETQPTAFGHAYDSRRSVQELAGAELGIDRYAADAFDDVGNLHLVRFQGLGVVGSLIVGMQGQLAHANEEVVGFGQRPFGGLNHGVGQFGVGNRLVDAGNLSAHLLGNNQPRRVVGPLVDSKSR